MQRMTKPTVPDAIMTTGWSKGIAAQVSLPNILLPSLRRDGRHMTRRNLVEQTFAHPRVGLRSVGFGGLSQFLKSPGVQYATLRFCRVDPVPEGPGFSRYKIKAHVGEAITAELR